MTVPKRSNCFLWAWGRFVDHGGYLLIRRTKLSKLSPYATLWWWYPIAFIGIALQWLAIIINLIGWGMRWGEWFHVAWTPDRQKYWEYVPLEAPKRYFPALIFRGGVKGFD